MEGVIDDVKFVVGESSACSFCMGALMTILYLSFWSE